MAQRLLAFALALVFAATPVAGQICEAMCAEHVAPSLALEGSVALHHHHHSQENVFDAQNHAGRHTAGLPGFGPAPLTPDCRQTEAVVTESREVVRGPMASGVAPSSGLTLAIASVRLTRAEANRHSPLPPARSISQIRI